VIGESTLIGKKLGAYELQALIGQGGMSRVYRGFDERLRRPVAVKVLAEAVAAQPGFVERFRQEARLIASLRHPHIVQVYDFGEQDGLTYMVQELLPGPTLEQRMREVRARGETFVRQEILTITAQLASALDAAHAAGIIHRDVKPGNAIWNAAGALMLTDFGVAKNTLTAANQTQAGVVFGTPISISPEQAQGLPLTPASDIYALGVLLYELIGGHPPFEQGTPMEIVLAHIQTPPPPLHGLRPDLPPAAEAVVLRALAKNPAERFSSAAELAQAIERAWPQQPATAGVSANGRIDTTPFWNKPTAISTPAVVSARPLGLDSVAFVPAPSAVSAPASAPIRRGPRALLIAVAALLALLLLGAAALLRGGVGDPVGATRSATVMTAVIPPTAASVAVPTAVAGGAGAQSTVVPAPPPSPAPKPTVAPVVPADPLAQLSALLNDERTGKEGGKLRAALNQVQQALAKGDKQRAGQRLSDLRQRVQADAQTGKLAPDFAQQVLSTIDAMANRYELTLTQAGGKDKGKGEG
jgi:eukaryotic-like serine/threonine-protein kinase